MQQSKRQAGFSMVEILVSILILGTGLLGLAALQSKALRYNYDAQLRAQAIAQINSMADRMRANPAGIAAGSFDALVPSIGETQTVSCTTCTPSQSAIRDYLGWIRNTHQMLPSGVGQIIKNGTTYEITVMWDNDRTGATGLNCSGDNSVDLTCLRMNVEL